MVGVMCKLHLNEDSQGMLVDDFDTQGSNVDGYEFTLEKTSARRVVGVEILSDQDSRVKSIRDRQYIERVRISKVLFPGKYEKESGLEPDDIQGEKQQMIDAGWLDEDGFQYKPFSSQII